MMNIRREMKSNQEEGGYCIGFDILVEGFILFHNHLEGRLDVDGY